MLLRVFTLICALAATTASKIQEQTVLQNSRASEMNFLQVSEGNCVDKSNCLRKVKVSVICKNGVCSVQDNSDDEDFELSFELSANGPDNEGCCEPSSSPSESSSESPSSSSSESPSESSSESPSESSSSGPSESSSESPSSSSSESPSESSSESPSESSSSGPSESSSESPSSSSSESPSESSSSSPSESSSSGCPDPYAKVVCEEGKCTQSDKDGNVLNVVDLPDLDGDSCIDEFTLVLHCDSNGCVIQQKAL